MIETILFLIRLLKIKQIQIFSKYRLLTTNLLSIKVQIKLISLSKNTYSKDRKDISGSTTVWLFREEELKD